MEVVDSGVIIRDKRQDLAAILDPRALSWSSQGSLRLV